MHTILAVATNAAPDLGSFTSGLWLSELTHFLDVVEEAGFDWQIASPAGGRIPLDEHSTTAAQLRDPSNVRFQEDPRLQDALADSAGCADVDPADYAAVYLAGGHGTMWDFRDSAALQGVLTELYGRGALLSGVCHGVAGFVDTQDADGKRIVEGRTVTGFSNFEDRLARSLSYMPFRLEDELKRSGARYRKNLLPFTSRVEVDGPLITGQNPQSARAVGEHVVEALRQR